MENFLKNDHLTDAVFSLAVVRHHLEAVSNNPLYWKWIIIALHNSVQGFMVSAAKGGSGLAVLGGREVKKWHEARSEGKPIPLKGKLRKFMELYDLIKSERMLIYIKSRSFVATPDHDRSIGALNAIRNDFIHFVPHSWLLELDGLPRICVDCLDVVSFCAFDSGNVLWGDTDTAGIKKDLRALSVGFSALRNKYEETP